MSVKCNVGVGLRDAATQIKPPSARKIPALRFNGRPSVTSNEHVRTGWEGPSPDRSDGMSTDPLLSTSDGQSWPDDPDDASKRRKMASKSGGRCTGKNMEDTYLLGSVGINGRGAVMEAVIQERNGDPTSPRALRGRS
jgi:hypothetical protein